MRAMLVTLLALGSTLALAGAKAEKTPEEQAAETKAGKEAKEAKETKGPKKIPNYRATLKTAKGEIVLTLLAEDAPETVANFVQLAQGERPWKDKDGRWVARPFYHGLTFCRIEKDLLIQGGDPKGDCTGGPGYRFRDEITPKLRFDRAGIVAMASTGRNSNGSQFFIALAPMPRLDGFHTIFATVASGIDVVKKISEMPAVEPTAVGAGIHLAKDPVAIESVTIEEVKETPKPKKAED